MKSTLAIKDLSLSKELDAKGMSAVVGGNAQANGLTQLNLQSLLAANNVGNNLSSGLGPIIVQSDIDNTQTADNTATQVNDKFALLAFIDRF